jgi:hypothetical protein
LARPASNVLPFLHFEAPTFWDLETACHVAGRRWYSPPLGLSRSPHFGRHPHEQIETALSVFRDIVADMVFGTLLR